MSPQQVLALGVRLFAIWLVVRLIMFVPFQFAQVSAYYSQTYGQAGASGAQVYYGIAALLVLVVFFVLWRFPLTVASRIMPGSVQETDEPRSPDLWLAMGCALIGLWLLSTSIPTLFVHLMQYLEALAGRLPYPRVMLTQNIVEVAIGVWLVFGARGFRRLFWWVRNAGRTQPEK